MTTTLEPSPATELRAELLHGLCDPSRQRILDALVDGELRVVDLVASTGLSQPNVSKHLRCLRGCGLVQSDKRGRETYYAVADGLDALFGAIDAFAFRVAPDMACCDLTDDTIGRRS